MSTYVTRSLSSRALMGLLLSCAFALAAPSAAAAQNRDLLTRLVGAQNNSEAAARAFTEGRTLLDEQKWSQAVITFGKFLADYPTDRNADAAMYWLAYASEKQGKDKQAEMMLGSLLSNFPRST